MTASFNRIVGDGLGIRYRRTHQHASKPATNHLPEFPLAYLECGRGCVQAGLQGHPLRSASLVWSISQWLLGSTEQGKGKSFVKTRTDTARHMCSSHLQFGSRLTVFSSRRRGSAVQCTRHPSSHICSTLITSSSHISCFPVPVGMWRRGEGVVNFSVAHRGSEPIGCPTTSRKKANTSAGSHSTYGMIGRLPLLPFPGIATGDQFVHT